MREAGFYKKGAKGRLNCFLCLRTCVIPEGGRGFCRVRENREGILYSLIYGRVASWAISPIEKKPLYHFYPQSRWLSLGTLGCNFRCPGCQNYDISHITDIPRNFYKTTFITPQRLLNLASTYKVKGLSFTYNEPTIWTEYILDVSCLAKREGYLINWVTNGSLSLEVLKEVIEYIDAYRVDIKGFSSATYERVANFSGYKGILNNAEFAFRKGVWIEIVTNIIPGYNDDLEELKKISLWIKNNLSCYTPWHLTKFFPYLKLKNISPTSIEILEDARRMAQDAGLKYVYIGNIDSSGNNTYCPECKSLIIERDNIFVLRNLLLKDKCPFCGYKIEGRFL